MLIFSGGTECGCEILSFVNADVEEERTRWLYCSVLGALKEEYDVRSFRRRFSNVALSLSTNLDCGGRLVIITFLDEQSKEALSAGGMAAAILVRVVEAMVERLSALGNFVMRGLSVLDYHIGYGIERISRGTGTRRVIFSVIGTSRVLRRRSFVRNHDYLPDKDEDAEFEADSGVLWLREYGQSEELNSIRKGRESWFVFARRRLREVGESYVTKR
ncbi:hypothetical protein Dimus_037496 [Dionaea muscipula]